MKMLKLDAPALGWFYLGALLVCITSSIRGCVADLRASRAEHDAKVVADSLRSAVCWVPRADTIKAKPDTVRRLSPPKRH
jgi:hypothetical protein